MPSTSADTEFTSLFKFNERYWKVGRLEDNEYIEGKKYSISERCNAYVDFIQDIDMTLIKTVKLDQFCKSIMTSDRNILSVSIIDNRGTVVHNEIIRGVSPPKLDRWNDIHYMECTFDISMGAKFDNFYGPIRYHFSDKDTFMMFSFPYYKNVVIVTSTKKVSPIALATKISHVILDSISEPKEKRF